MKNDGNRLRCFAFFDLTSHRFPSMTSSPPSPSPPHPPSPQPPQGASVEVPRELRSRLLFPNPVCFLTTWDPETRERNVMTISWITPLSNRGTMIASMNAGRHSAGIVRRTRRFVLSVPTQPDEALVLAVGGCSGRDGGDKADRLGVPLCAVGWGEWAPGDAHAEATTTDNDNGISNTAARVIPPSLRERAAAKAAAEAAELARVTPPAVAANCCAHLSCVVDAIDEADGHLILRATIDRAFVRAKYWTGRQFIADDPTMPPYLTFLGAQRFAYVSPTTSTSPRTPEEDGLLSPSNALGNPSSPA